MAASQKGDTFANYAIIYVAESAANTLTFKKLETGISIHDKMAWIFNRIEYSISQAFSALFNGTGDDLRFGFSVANSWTSATHVEESIIDFNKIVREDIGAAASGLYQVSPVIKDFSTLPGGGLMVPPVPLYLWAVGTGLAAAATVTARISYTARAVSIDEYWELVEARRVISS